ncbi:hypothetical protein Halha_2118 [Halobacteroides halobius DSM 5150]|uniref:Uncharacterized protein n=1 Tax=Halobacteroides halobius (strain ATCC 35273 / DSM 5150 / MD-1) TaxID=748449 RepID=L0K9M6_HALHC|nr:hypothetical protein [Halobacteroides halobius]AGB42002.1 hypothetical protein Halha_2118 [Halobacteroides halobius DSM 5150]
MLWISAIIILLGLGVFYFYWLKDDTTEDQPPLNNANYNYDMETGTEIGPETKGVIEPLMGNERNQIELGKLENDNYQVEAGKRITPKDKRVIEVINDDDE